MRLLITFAATAALMFGQDQKPAPPTAAPIAAPGERTLTEAEILKYQVSALQIDRLRKAYKIDEFNEKIQQFSSEQQNWYVTTCKSIGLTDEQIKANECGLTVGVDLDGKPVNGPDGKPAVSRVWHNKPAEPLKTDPPKK